MKLAGFAGGLVLAFIASPALSKPAALPEGARYVAMGSSFAAGPGVGPNTPDTPARCGRGTLNYPNLVAQRLKLKDMSVEDGLKILRANPAVPDAERVSSRVPSTAGTACPETLHSGCGHIG